MDYQSLAPIADYLRSTDNRSVKSLTEAISPEGQARFVELLKGHPFACGVRAEMPADWLDCVCLLKSTAEAISPGKLHSVAWADKNVGEMVAHLSARVAYRSFHVLSSMLHNSEGAKELRKQVNGQGYQICLATFINALKTNEELAKTMVLQPDDKAKVMQKGEGYFAAPAGLDVLTPNLRVLDLSSCWIKKVTPEIGRFAHLTVLNLSGNRMKCLPDTIGNLVTLQELKLKDCKNLTTLPASVLTLPNLKVLDIRGTDIDVNKIDGIATLFDRGVQVRTTRPEVKNIFADLTAAMGMPADLGLGSVGRLAALMAAREAGGEPIRVRVHGAEELAGLMAALREAKGE